MSYQASYDAHMQEAQENSPQLQTEETNSGSNIFNGSELTQSNAWDKYNLLSLDGGGIRGYWSLLVLEKLFECIASEEQKLDGVHMEHHSFAPAHWPEDVSHLITPEQRRSFTNAVGNQKFLAIDSAFRYLPCHYFDLMCGSSTGALIAIMLGRFRMPVRDCLHEYKRLGEEVFGKPRFVNTLRFKLGDRKKYSTVKLEKVLQDVAKRHGEEMEDGQRVKFPMRSGLCKVVVTTMKHTKKIVELPYFLRTYDHQQACIPISTANQPRTPGSHPSRSNTNRSGMPHVSGQEQQAGRINYGTAHDFEVWEVARAATAANFYFEPFEREPQQSGQHISFTDGGFSLLNNPTKEGVREIRELNEHNTVNIVVSVGTARSTRSNIKKRKIFSLLNTAQEAVDKQSDPEVIHNEMVMKSHEGSRFDYYRLNNPESLGIPLDGWEPKRSVLFPEKEAGSKTIETIEKNFHRWASNNENIEYLQNCADNLVRCRRERMSTPQWERYATGCIYTCRASNCERESFLHLDAFLSHLRDQHKEITDPTNRAAEWRNQWRYQDRY